MARRYVRDKIGRFASHGGGGSFGGGGKVGKSAKNVKARAAYKNQAGKLREAKKAASGAAKGGDARRSAYANRQLGGAKSGMTRVSNRLTGKGAAKARTGMKKTGSMVPNANKLASSKKFAAARKAPKGSAVRKDAVASAKIKRGERRVRAANKPVVGRKTYKKGPGATERKAAVTGKTMKSTVGRKEKAAYRAKTPEHERSGVRLKRYGNPYGSHALGGGIQRDRRADHAAKRNVKKRRGGKVYDNTTNTFIKIKTKKRDLKRKYKYGYS